MFRIAKAYRETNLRGNKILLTSHFLFMIGYSSIILLLLML
jgi:hypothetical protein